MIDDTRLISRQMAVALGSALFFIGVIEIVLFSFSGQLPPHFNPFVTYFVIASCIVVTPLLLFAATKYNWAKLVAITCYHVTTGALLLYFSEIFSPFTALWSMMILFASIYYGWKGFTGSSVALCLIGVLYCLLFPDDLEPGVLVYAAQAAMTILMTIITSYLFVRIIMDGRKKNIELENSQRSELMQVNRLNTLLNSISDAVMTLNRYGRVTSQNAAAQAFFDTNKSLVGRDIDKLLQLNDQADKDVSVRSLIDQIKSTLYRDDLSVGKGGDRRRLGIQLARIRSTFDDSEEYGVVVIIRDITKQKTLEDEKDEFISVTSHELRTPIAIAEGSLSNLIVLYERHADEDKLKGAAQTAYDQIIYLAKMINDLSTLSRAERGVGEEVESLDTNELVHDMFSRYVGEAEKKNLHLDLDVDPDLPEINTSRLYLEEILQNFITNAIKYTKAGSVTIIAKKEPDNKVKFAVTDTGIGISRSDIEHVFEKFYRSEDYRTRETSGTGLGLYVVEKLAAKLKTKIDVKSRLNFGTTFSFTLPAATQGADQEEAKAVAAVETAATAE